MTEHLHSEFVPGCYRCDLSRDEVEMHGDHVFAPGIDIDMAAEGREPDPSWCNVCGEPVGDGS